MTGEKKWTPGPWVKSGWAILDEADRTVICNVLPWDVSGCRQEDTANANLIAVAPELYDALDATLTAICSWGELEELGINLVDVINNASDALAKAREERT